MTERRSYEMKFRCRSPNNEKSPGFHSPPRA
nr:MAG TPA: hypothetical protein [Caudoviricetes sp.]